MAAMSACWLVEARAGGVEGRSRWWEFAREPDVMGLVADLTEPNEDDQWRELPVR